MTIVIVIVIVLLVVVVVVVVVVVAVEAIVCSIGLAAYAQGKDSSPLQSLADIKFVFHAACQRISTTWT